MSEKTIRVYELLIKTTPERLWQSLVDGELTKDYYYGGRVESTWQKDAPYRIVDSDGQAGVFGKVLEATPNSKLVTTFETAWDPEGTKPSLLTWQISPASPLTRLSLTHEDFDPVAFEAGGVNDGWVLILSGIKTLLETGEPMGAPASPEESEAAATN